MRVSLDDCDRGDSLEKKSNFGAEEADEEYELQGNQNDCVSRCKRLRFSPARQESCIDDCDRGDSLEKKSNFGAEEADEEYELQGNQNACVSRCKRLRFSPARQESCIADCDRDGSSQNRSNFGAEEADEVYEFLGNQGACASLCKRLRLSPARQSRCIDACQDEQDETKDDASYAATA